MSEKKYTKEYVRKVAKRYMQFIDHTAECRVCGSACEFCYRLARAKQLKIEWVPPEPGSCGGGGGVYNQDKPILSGGAGGVGAMFKKDAPPYIIVVSENVKNLSLLVIEKMRLGYIPVGGVTYVDEQKNVACFDGQIGTLPTGGHMPMTTFAASLMQAMVMND